MESRPLPWTSCPVLTGPTNPGLGGTVPVRSARPGMLQGPPGRNERNEKRNKASYSSTTRSATKRSRRTATTRATATTRSRTTANRRS